MISLFNVRRKHTEADDQSILSVSEGAGLPKLRQKMLREFPERKDAIDCLIDNYGRFARTGKTPDEGYYALRDLYWQTRGHSNAIIGDHVRSLFPVDAVPDRIASALGGVSSDGLTAIVDQIKDQGFYRFPTLLPRPVVNEIKSQLDLEAAAGNLGGTIVNADLARITFREKYLMSVEPVTNLAADPLLRAIASQYLQTSSVLGFITSWISRAHSNAQEVLSSSAQMFHFDMSNPNFLKVFLYLDEVTDRNGPHCVVPKSNRIRDARLWRDGRITDEEMSEHYPEEDWAVLRGPPGSMFVVDTSAFHKGCALLEGERHILQFYYVDTLFGEHVPAEELASTPVPSFAETPRRFRSRLIAGV